MRFGLILDKKAPVFDIWDLCTVTSYVIWFIQEFQIDSRVHRIIFSPLKSKATDNLFFFLSFRLLLIVEI